MVLVEGLEVIPGLYSHIAALVLGAALAGLGAWQAQALRYDARIADMRQAHAQASADAAQKAMDDTIKMQRTKDAAIQQAEQRAAQNAAAADTARRTVDGLRGTLYEFRASLPSASTAALITRADTAAELFGACVNEYRSVAESADRHASDAVMLIEAWPSNVDR